MSKRRSSAAAAAVLAHIEELDEVITPQEVAMEVARTTATRRKYDVAQVRAEAAQLTKDVAGVSAKIRHLIGAGWERGKIAVGLDKRYQHVRNVATQKLKSA
jgi:hypothetical protein